MLTRLGLARCLACGVVVHSSAQDPTKTLPEAYKVQFENDYARVVRVHYDAGASGPDEHHTAGNAAATPSDFLRIEFLRVDFLTSPR